MIVCVACAFCVKITLNICDICVNSFNLTFPCQFKPNIPHFQTHFFTIHLSLLAETEAQRKP